MRWVGINKQNLKEWFKDREQFEFVMWVCKLFNAQEIRGVEIQKQDGDGSNTNTKGRSRNVKQSIRSGKQ
jgi:hypothetical protein